MRGYGFEPSRHRNGIRCLSAWRSASMAGLQCVAISGTKHKGSAGLNNSSKKKVAKMRHICFPSCSTELFVPGCKCHIHNSCNTLKSSSPTHYTTFPAARQHFAPFDSACVAPEEAEKPCRCQDRSTLSPPHVTALPIALLEHTWITRVWSFRSGLFLSPSLFNLS